ncbi:MAG TPA: hypothetical protein VF168_11240 [Trueperaceae bacterium]
MSAEGEQQRRPGAPDDSDGKRRLRAISYPDPYLVTKLPLEGTVNSGVIRLGERMLLGFIHRPYPDGTRVRVVYDEWLFAERIEEGSGGAGGGPGEASPDAGGGSERPRKGKGGSGRKSKAKRPTGPDRAESEAGPADATAAPPSRREPLGRVAEKPGGQMVEEAGEPAPAAAPATARRPADFPDDFSDPHRPASDEIGGPADAWTDTFGSDEREA